MMKKLALLASTLSIFLAACASVPPVAEAQVANVVTTCGSIPHTPTNGTLFFMDINGNLCTSAAVSVSASISGFQQTSPTSFASRSATGTSARVVLPPGSEVVIFNTGTNVGSINIGDNTVTASAATTPIQPGSWFAQKIVNETNLAAYSAAGTTFVIVGGDGLPTGSGGGSSGGGAGGDVNIASAGGNPATTGSGAITSGTLRVTLASGTTVGIASGALVGIDPANNGVTVTGGVVGISGTVNSQTFDGNGVLIGSTGDSLHTAITTVAGSGAALSSKQAAPGTAGTPSSDVTTTQGISGGTPLGTSSADGGNVTMGAKADSAITNPASSCSLIACTKGLLTGQALQATVAAQNTAQTSLTAIQTSTGTIATNSGTQATAALQTSGNSTLTNIKTDTGTIATASATQATAANQIATQGTVAPGTAATKSSLGGCVYTTTAPAPSDTQGLAIRCDSTGKQLTSAAPAGATQNGYQQITSLSAATALTVPGGSTMAVIVCESQAVRFRPDGTNPTASVGMPLAVGQTLVYTGDLSVLKFIQQTASATLDVLYFK